MVLRSLQRSTDRLLQESISMEFPFFAMRLLLSSDQLCFKPCRRFLAYIRDFVVNLQLRLSSLFSVQVSTQDLEL